MHMLRSLLSVQGAHHRSGDWGGPEGFLPGVMEGAAEPVTKHCARECGSTRCMIAGTRAKPQSPVAWDSCHPQTSKDHSKVWRGLPETWRRWHGGSVPPARTRLSETWSLSDMHVQWTQSRGKMGTLTCHTLVLTQWSTGSAGPHTRSGLRKGDLGEGEECGWGNKPSI